MSTREYNLAYKEAHREEIRTQQKEYREQNKDKIAAKKKAYREKNRTKINNSLQIYRKTNKEYLQERRMFKRQYLRNLKDKPCMDCKVKYNSWQMDYDHVRGEKLFSIGEQYLECGEEKLLKEIAKCDLVCSNCHRVRTVRRLRAL